MNNKKQVNLQEKIMRKIEEEKITIRSRYIFLAKKLGLNGGFALSLILAVLFFNIAFFSLKSSGNLEFISFGRIGLFVFLESFPYEWIIFAVLFFIGASLLLSRYDVSYKKPFKILVVVLLVVVLSASTILAISGINENLERKATENTIPILKIFYGPRKGIWRHGLVGEIIQIQTKAFVLQTSQEKQVIVKLTEKLHSFFQSDFKTGDYIRVVGEWKDNDFQAFAIRRCSHSRSFRKKILKREG